MIKAHFGPQPTAGRLVERLRRIRVSEGTLDAIERLVRARRLKPARAVKPRYPSTARS